MRMDPELKKMLAWKLCKQQTERSVFKIKNPESKCNVL